MSLIIMRYIKSIFGYFIFAVCGVGSVSSVFLTEQATAAAAICDAFTANRYAIFITYNTSAGGGCRFDFIRTFCLHEGGTNSACSRAQGSADDGQYIAVYSNRRAVNHDIGIGLSNRSSADARADAETKCTHSDCELIIEVRDERNTRAGCNGVPFGNGGCRLSSSERVTVVARADLPPPPTPPPPPPNSAPENNIEVVGGGSSSGGGGGGAGVAIGALAAVGVVLYFLSHGEDDVVSFTPNYGYSITESGYSANAGGRMDFRKDNWHLYFSGDFRFSSEWKCEIPLSIGRKLYGGLLDGGIFRIGFRQNGGL